MRNNVLYGLDDRPPLGKAVVLAMQHVLTMFGSTVAVPLLLGPAMGMDTAAIALLISSVMLCSGIATLIQATFGSRLPIIQGVSFSFLAAFFMIIATIHPEGETVTPGAAMPYIAGAIIVGAVFEIAIGFSGLMGQIRKVLSPVVVGPVIMLIGLALYTAGAPIAAAHWPISILTMVLITVFSFIWSRHHLVFQMFPMLLAILTAVGVCALCAFLGVFGPGHPARPNLDAFEQSPWFRVQDVFLPWGMPKFQLGFIVAVVAGYLASMIESFGDYHACKQMAGGGDPTPEEISRGIGCEGIGCALTGIFGGFSSTSYSENVGLIGLTKVGSRYVVQIGALILILLGLFGKFGALAAAIPQPVVGGLYCVMFGLISAVGIRQFARADLSSDRNLFIGGFALFMGISVPYYFANGGSEAVQATFIDGLDDVINAIGQTGMAVAAILGVALDNLIPGTRRERGLEPQ
ncbi:Uric acid transporter UacT [Stieleria maiorica]|uniref:Uric acid transporter UacT n=1 Tax=Stieleria maiorica TaxID=2795974 RepID=A0A5B9M734_9BACT|nr:solute carrier family 23 protein [Stieleria maiorica]QEF96483.1 Uric acid transporter UacT [Stieleria maiorica]